MSTRSLSTIRPSLSNGVLTAMLLVGLQMAAPAALAIALPAKSPLPLEAVHLAVHLPTGCVAELTTNEGHLIKAQIVDTDCLPEGSAPRDVPGTLRDFSKTRETGVSGWRP